MQTIPAVEQNKNIKWSESPWNQSVRKGKVYGGKERLHSSSATIRPANCCRSAGLRRRSDGVSVRRIILITQKGDTDFAFSEQRTLRKDLSPDSGSKFCAAEEFQTVGNTIANTDADTQLECQFPGAEILSGKT